MRVQRSEVSPFGENRRLAAARTVGGKDLQIWSMLVWNVVRSNRSGYEPARGHRISKSGR
jgi:hypothetical protein